MVNLFKVKKWSAGFIMGFLPLITFVIMIITTDFIQALIGSLLVMMVGIVLGFRFLKHPMMDFLEGAGLLVLTLDSTGVIESFIVKVANPYLIGMHRGQQVETVFNREAVEYMGYPQKVNATSETFFDKKLNDEVEKLTLNIPKSEKNSIMHGFQHFPVLVYNNNTKQFLTKELLAKHEENTYVNHMVLYLNRKVEDLTTQLRDFGRYVVEQTRPGKSIFAAGWVKWVIIFAAILLIFLFVAPYAMSLFTGVSKGVTTGTESIVKPLGG